MGFQYWHQSLVFIFWFFVIIALPCFFTGRIGTKMINDFGNFPSKAAEIQKNALWKIFVIEGLFFAAIFIFFQLFS